VFGRVDAHAREADAHEIRQVVREALLYVLTLRVQVHEPLQPARVEVQRVRPGVEHPLAVEILRPPGHGRELLRRRQPRHVGRLVDVGLRVRRRRPRRQLRRVVVGVVVGSGGVVPQGCGGARFISPLIAARVLVLGVRVVAAAHHVVQHGVGVRADAQAPARMDRAAQGGTRPHAPPQPVRHGLVHEVPRVQSVALERLATHDLLLRREKLGAHVPSVCEEG
jgi:hypothetical protein